METFVQLELTQQSFSLTPSDLRLHYDASRDVWLAERNGLPALPIGIAFDGISTLHLTLNGYTYTTKVYTQEHATLLRILTASQSGKPKRQKVVAPMPGLLKGTYVHDEQEVHKGQTLFTLEAMKMENAIVAPFNGVIKSVKAIAGSAYEKGALLCMVEQGA
jgi:biotin carboxyl carrier protein